MPTIILLDNSLSMNKLLDGDNKLTKRDLAFKIINRIIDHLSINEKFEHISLVKILL